MKIVKTLTREPLFFNPELKPHIALDGSAFKLRDELNRLIRSHEVAQEDVPCLCGSDEAYLISELDRYGVFQRTVMCSQCGLIQGMPRMNAKALDWFYSSDYYRKLYDADLSAMTPEFVRDYSQKYSRLRYEAIKTVVNYPKITSVFELGAAAGWNLLPFHEDGKKVLGFDLGSAFASVGKKLGMDLRVGSVETLTADQKFDVIILSHVAEHFLSPFETINKLKSHLNPGGVLYIEVPNMDAFGMGQIQSAHTYYFTPRTLAYFMESNGWKLIGLRKDILGSHMAAMFVPDAKGERTVLNLRREPERMKRIIRAFEWKQRIKRLLRRK